MGKFFYYLGQVIKEINVFKTPVCLRYDFDSDYDTFLGGFLTIGLFIIFFVLFIGQWIQLFNKDNVNFTTKIIRQSNPSYSTFQANQFMFAVGFLGLDQSSKQYFNVSMSRTKLYNSTVIKQKINLQPCTSQHWSPFGQKFKQYFQNTILNTFLCPPKNITYQLSGKFASSQFQYYKISIDKCSGSNCATAAQIQEFLNQKTTFDLDFFYTNTLINPQQKVTTQKYFQDGDYLKFSNVLGSQANIYLGDYQIQTDQNLVPWENKQIEKGIIVDRSLHQQLTYSKTQNESYAKIYLRKSNIKYQYQRSFKKIDQMLSYIGGLFGLVAVLFGFLMDYYSRCAFQLQLCQQFFDYHRKQETNYSNRSNKSNDDDQNQKENSKNEDKDDQTIQPDDFGLIDFFFHIFYRISTLFCQIKWKRQQIYFDSVEEMRYKLDVGLILQKFAFYDRSISALFTENQLKLLHLQQRFNFQDLRHQRRLLNMKNQIVQNNVKSIKLDVSNKEIQSNQKLNYQPDNDLSLKQKKQRKKLDYLVIQTYLKNAFKKNKFNQGNQIQQKKYEFNIQPDIKYALMQLQNKIDQKDLISIRIYNGLQANLIESYQRNKLNDRINNNQTNQQFKIDNMKQFEKKNKYQLERKNSKYLKYLDLHKNDNNLNNKYNNQQKQIKQIIDQQKEIGILGKIKNNFSELFVFSGKNIQNNGKDNNSLERINENL